jgi:hypothetical protein
VELVEWLKAHNERVAARQARGEMLSQVGPLPAHPGVGLGPGLQGATHGLPVGCSLWRCGSLGPPPTAVLTWGAGEVHFLGMDLYSMFESAQAPPPSTRHARPHPTLTASRDPSLVLGYPRPVEPQPTSWNMTEPPSRSSSTPSTCSTPNSPPWPGEPQRALLLL